MLKQPLLRRLAPLIACVALIAALLGACGITSSAASGTTSSAASGTARITPRPPRITPRPSRPPVRPRATATPRPPTPVATATPTARPVGGPLLPPLNPLPPVDVAFDGERAYQYLSDYMQFQPRVTGSPGWQQAGDYIIAQVQQAGWTIEEQRFTYQNTPVRNIIAKKGRGPVLMLGAHYDARRRSDKDPDPAKQNVPMPGANDGGSGVAVLLELARHINTDQLGREVWLAFFDAEDNGNLDDGWDYTVGSRYMAEHLTVRPEALVLLDMIGDRDLGVYYEQTSTDTLSQSIWAVAAELGYKQFVPLPKYSVIDDHTAFLNKGIPAVDLIDFDYPHWHTSNDTIDKVSAESLAATGRTVERWLDTRAAP